MSVWADVRVGLRRLLADRGYTTAAVVTLALGIAATSTIFTIVNATFLRPMPFDDPERIVEFDEVSYRDLQDLRRTLRTFESVGALDERSIAIADAGLATERYLGAFVSANTFSLIGVQPALGRDFRPEDDRPGAPPVVILGNDLWRTRYGSDPAVINRTIRVNGMAATVVGVMPDPFAFPMNAEAWLPVSMLPADVLDRRDAQPLSGIGRLRPGVTRPQATADLQSAFDLLDRAYPDVTRRPRPVKMSRAGVDADTPAGTMFLFLFGAVGFVLLIACANVANLLLVRAAARAREVSVRLSLGAGRWRVLRQLLIESLLLSAMAGTVALALSVFSLRALWRVMLASGQVPPYWLTFDLDVRVFTFLAAVCVATALITGLAPAWVTAKGSLVDLLSEAGRGAVGTRRNRRWTAAFVVGQLALALILLTGAGLMVRGVLAQLHTDAGVDISTLIAARLDLGSSSYTPERRAVFYGQLEERIAELPDMTASFASEVPLAGVAELQLDIEGRDDIAPENRPLVGRMTVGSNYFRAVGAPVLRGRTFRHDDADADRVAIVNERLAEMYFAGADPIGRRVRLLPSGAAVGRNSPPARWLTIIAVTSNVRQRSVEGGDFDPLVYVPLAANPFGATTIVARSALPLVAAAGRLREQVAELDADVPLFNIQTVEDAVAFEGWGQRFTGSLLSIVAAVALLLATVGIYAIAAYSASQRTREIGVRLALGALPRHIWWLVTRGASAQLAGGLILGSAGAIAIARVLPTDVTGGGAGLAPLMAVAVLLVMVAGVALALPARRAMRVNPAAVLRGE